MALLYPQLQFFDNNGDPLSLGYIYTYQAGTTTPLAAYTDAGGLTALPNPIRLDANGFANPGTGETGIWLGTVTNYKIKIFASDNLTQIGPTIDNVSGIGNTLSFYSTLTHNLDTNNYSLVTTSGNYDITFSPNGTGRVHNTGNEQIDGTLTVNGTAATGALTVTGAGVFSGNHTIGTAAGSLTVRSNTTTPGKVIIQTNSGANTTTITSNNSQSSDLTWTTPTSYPSSSGNLISDSSGNLSVSSERVFLGYLNQANSWSSTSLLSSSYNLYELELVSGINFSNGASPPDPTLIQFYVGGAFRTATYGNCFTYSAAGGGGIAPNNQFSSSGIILSSGTYFTSIESLSIKIKTYVQINGGGGGGYTQIVATGTSSGAAGSTNGVISGGLQNFSTGSPADGAQVTGLRLVTSGTTSLYSALGSSINYPVFKVYGRNG